MRRLGRELHDVLFLLLSFITPIVLRPLLFAVFLPILRTLICAVCSVCLRKFIHSLEDDHYALFANAGYTDQNGHVLFTIYLLTFSFP